MEHVHNSRFYCKSEHFFSWSISSLHKFTWLPDKCKMASLFFQEYSLVLPFEDAKMAYVSGGSTIALEGTHYFNLWRSHLIHTALCSTTAWLASVFNIISSPSQYFCHLLQALITDEAEMLLRRKSSRASQVESFLTSSINPFQVFLGGNIKHM